MTIGTLLWLLPLAAIAAGCARFSDDSGMNTVAEAARREFGVEPVKIVSETQAEAARARVRTLLARPLDANTAVELALLNNRGLQAAYNELGLSEVSYVEAALPPSPRLSLERMSGGGVVEIELRLVANLLSLLTMPARRQIAAEQFRQAQTRAIDATFRLAAATRRAHVRAVAAAQTVDLLEKARVTTDAAADLMQKLGETGGATRLDQARTAGHHAETAALLARARLAARLEREALTRLLGLWGQDIAFKLPATLPALPRAPRAAERIENEAVLRNVELALARHEYEATAKGLGLAESTRYISMLELGGIAQRERESADGTTTRTSRRGIELELRVPIFDLGETTERRAGEQYLRAYNRLIETATNVRSEARAAYQAYRASLDIARQYRDRVVPLRQTAADEALLRYNGMLIDVFPLLATAREAVAGNAAAIEAARDFFLAEIDLKAATIGGGGAGRTAAAAGGTTPSRAPAEDH
jgi:outer membrane protein TolC